MPLDDPVSPEERDRALQHLIHVRHRASRRRRLQALVATALVTAMGLGIGLPFALSGSPRSQTVRIIGNPARTTIPTTVAPTLTQATTTLPSAADAGLDQLRSGYYVDSTQGPGYVLTVTRTPSGVTGWMFFVYQDGHVSETFHYHSTTAVPGLLLSVTMVTDTTSAPFPYGSPPSFPQAGSQPIPPGHTFSGTYGTIGTTALRLSNCGTYLYWANPANISKPMSCSFTYNGTNTW